MKTVLVTGGAGYIGSHICVALIESGIQPIILDNFSNSNISVLASIEKITSHKIIFERGDVCDENFVKLILIKYNVNAVIHLAAFKSVSESVEHPLQYYENNIGGTISLLKAMESQKCNTLLFSSSAAVYGYKHTAPFKEDSLRSYTNPYAHTKLICEDILQALNIKNNNIKIGILRYFNPVGAHHSGLIGESSLGVPNNLMPYICQVALGKISLLKIYGNDYETHDGTGVRDYIHIDDLVNGHIASLTSLLNDEKSFILNLGTGVGYSVLDVVNTFENVNKVSIPYQMVDRRVGDVAKSFADPSLAKKIINWEAKSTLKDMCRDAWRWERLNADQYL